MPGVLICPDHGCFLESCTINTDQSIAKYCFIPPSLKVCYRREPRFTDSVIIKGIATRIQGIFLNKHTVDLDYRKRLEHLNSVWGTRWKLRQLGDAFLRFYPKDVLTLYGTFTKEEITLPLDVIDMPKNPIVNLLLDYFLDTLLSTPCLDLSSISEQEESSTLKQELMGLRGNNSLSARDKRRRRGILKKLAYRDPKWVKSFREENLKAQSSEAIALESAQLMTLKVSYDKLRAHIQADKITKSLLLRHSKIGRSNFLYPKSLEFLAANTKQRLKHKKKLG